MSNSELLARAQKVLAGANTNIPGAGFAPRFMVRGEGAHLWDADEKEYIDYVLSAGPLIFGHSHPEFIAALKSQLDTLWSLNSTVFQEAAVEVEASEKVVQNVPCADKVHYAATGTEAVQLALRLARAFTKRRYVIRFEGHYHGLFDNVIGGVVDEKRVGKPFPKDSAETLIAQGRDAAAMEQSFLLPWNDLDVLSDVLKRYGDEVAMVIMEPILCNAGCCPPRPGYLEGVRELCTRYGIVLCFDEVITGFRVALNSAQGLFGVTPDIATFGKAMAGGLPLAAVTGKKEIMDLLLPRTVVAGGTFARQPLGMTGVIASIKLLEKDNGTFYRHIDKIQKQLTDGLKEIRKRRGVPLFMQGAPGVVITRFMPGDKEVAYSVRDFAGIDAQKERRWAEMMAEEGILLMFGGRFYFSLAHTEADIDRALESADRVLGRF